MSVENKTRSILSSPSDDFLTSNRGFVIRVRFSLPKKRSFLPEGRGLNWLCIEFELALFFPIHQLPILAYQSVKKALTAFSQMLRLALFSQTKPFWNGEIEPKGAQKASSLGSIVNGRINLLTIVGLFNRVLPRCVRPELGDIGILKFRFLKKENLNGNKGCN